MPAGPSFGTGRGKQALDKVASIVNPDTILSWHRRLVAKKFDSSKNRPYPGRPRVDADIEELVVRLAKENKSWGYDRIAGALANLGHEVADQTVGNILKRHGIPLAPERGKTTTWREFIRSHMDVLTATDFFTAEVWTQGGLVTYYVLHSASRSGNQWLFHYPYDASCFIGDVRWGKIREYASWFEQSCRNDS